MGIKQSSYGLTILMLALATISQAQISFPKFDVEIKGGLAKVSADQTVDKNFNVDNISIVNLQAGAHWQLNQYIGIGWTYLRSVSGTVTYRSNDNNSTLPPQNVFLLMNGPNIRISTGRIKDWRPYLNLNYVAVEYVEDQGGYRRASKTNAYGFGVGIMRKLGSKLYWNLLELDAHIFSEKIYWLDSETLFEAKTGFTYNFGKQK